MLTTLPDGATVLVDGAVGFATDSLARESSRLRIALLVHRSAAEETGQEVGGAREQAAIRAAGAVIATSEQARDWVVGEHRVDPTDVRLARPGADLGSLSVGSAAGGTLVSIGPVTRDEGHDTLLGALAAIKDLDWRCVLVGAADVDQSFVDWLLFSARREGIAERLIFVGALARPGLDSVLYSSDLVVSASRRDRWNAGVSEGLASGVPAVATSVSAHSEALGRATDGKRPGVLVPVGDAGRLGAVLRLWLTDPGFRTQLRRTASRRRSVMPSWSETGAVLSEALWSLGEPRRGIQR